MENEGAMKLPVIVGSLLVFAASTAYAQAPGEFETIAPPSMTPVAAPVVVAPAEKVRRWSVGLGFGGLELAPHAAPDAKTQFDVGQLFVRYRPWRHLELELALGGGTEASDEESGYTGYREVSSAVLALRYRFNPQKRWNFWLMAGMGSLAVTNQDASDEERDAAHQSTLQFGAGIERRWSRFALQLELRAVGVAPHEEDAPTKEVPPMPINTDSTGTMPLPPLEPTRSNDGMKGGQFVFSGNYYF
jgi:hypothetical protein